MCGLFVTVMGVGASVVLQLPWFGGAVDTITLELSRFVVSREVPSDYRIAHCPYRGGGVLVARHDIQGSLAVAEREYSRHWMRRALRLTGVPTDVWTKNMRLTSNIGRTDDGAFLLYSYRGYSIEVIDYRALTVLVRKDGLGALPVVDIFADVMDVKAGHDVLLIEEHVVSDTEGYGRVRKVRRDGGRAQQGEFYEGIEWYRNGDAVLFLFTKELAPNSRKGRWRPEDGPTLIGGIPDDDPRPWLRFENSNRVELSQEYMQKRLEEERGKRMKEPQPDPDTPPKTHGRPAGPATTTNDNVP